MLFYPLALSRSRLNITTVKQKIEILKQPIFRGM